jgi:hypothetical protein
MKAIFTFFMALLMLVTVVSQSLTFLFSHFLTDGFHFAGEKRGHEAAIELEDFAPDKYFTIHSDSAGDGDSLKHEHFAGER